MNEANWCPISFQRCYNCEKQCKQANHFSCWFVQMNFTDTYRHKGLRKELAATLRSKGITDENVLAAIEKVPRHLFFGNDSIFFETHAYEDKAFPIGEGQTISQPLTVARQSELLVVKPGEKILEIGTGSGYQALVLMLLKAKVFTIERHKILHDRTSKFILAMKDFLVEQVEEKKDETKRTWEKKTAYSNIKCFFGDGFEGLPMYAPFDKIIITAAVPELPKKLLQQLALGGKMILPFGTQDDCDMLRITKHGDDQYETEKFEKFAFVPMLKGKVS